MNRIPALHRRINALKKTKEQDGTILSFTTIRHPPEGFGSETYTVALIEKKDGTKILAQLMKGKISPTIGAMVKPHRRKIREMNNGLKIYDEKYAIVTTKVEPFFSVKMYVLALSGPSGVGKTTITRSMLSLFSSYAEQVPIYTTRTPKKNEVEPYKYVSEHAFNSMIQSGEIVSHTHMPSKTELRYYGYRKKDIEEIWQKGKLPVVVTEINLLKGLVDTLGRRSVLSCGLLPPGKSKRAMLSHLLHRLRTRGREDEAQIAERLKVAEKDLQAFNDHAELFDHLVVNEELTSCVAKIQSLVQEQT